MIVSAKNRNLTFLSVAQWLFTTATVLIRAMAENKQ